MDRGNEVRVRACYYTALSVVCLVGLWLNIEPAACPVPKALLGLDAPVPPCLEFWINRYQALLSALLAFATAAIAAALLWKQLKANQLQADAAVGNVDPEFSLDWDFNYGSSEGELEDAIIRVQNYNRRPISIREIKLIKPSAAFLIQEFEKVEGVSADIASDLVAPLTLAINRWIPGRDPAGGMSIDVLRIVMADDGLIARSGEEEEVQFRVGYRLLGNKVDLRQIDVSGLVRRK